MTWRERFEFYRNDEVEQLCELRRQAGFLGISPGDFYNMDLKELLDFKFGVMQRRENEFNNMQNLLHRTAGKIAQAVWADKGFKTAFKDVHWTDDVYPDGKKKKAMRRQKETLDRIRRQYGINLVDMREEQ